MPEIMAAATGAEGPTGRSHLAYAGHSLRPSKRSRLSGADATCVWGQHGVNAAAGSWWRQMLEGCAAAAAHQRGHVPQRSTGVEQGDCSIKWGDVCWAGDLAGNVLQRVCCCWKWPQKAESCNGHAHSSQQAPASAATCCCCAAVPLLVLVSCCRCPGTNRSKVSGLVRAHCGLLLKRFHLRSDLSNTAKFFSCWRESTHESFC